MNPCLLGIDIGTSGTKAILVSPDGGIVGSVTRTYPLHNPKSLWSEQDPADWWHAVVASVRTLMEECRVTPGAIMAVGLTGQMHGLVALDQEGEVLRPCIMWNDQRTHEQCAEITGLVGEDRLIRITGKPVLPSFTAPKIAWVKTHEPHVYSRIAKILLPKDYIRYRLTGELLSEVSDASGTSLFDVALRTWSDDILSVLDVPRNWLPDVSESPVVSAHISEQGSKETGLLQGTPVVGGAGDQAAEAVGCGILSEGSVSVAVGTSGVVFAATDSYRFDPAGCVHAYCHAVPGAWHLMGVMLSAGGSLRWYRDTLCREEQKIAEEAGVDVYDVLTSSAAGVPPGSEGLIFLPYLTGERTPYADPYARATFFGMTLRHSKAHMTRSVLEGVAFGLNDSLDLMRRINIRFEAVRVSGGGSRSELWRRIMADVFNTRVQTVNVSEGAAFGAALLAGVGAEIYKDVKDACARTVRIQESHEPGEAVEAYRRYYGVYRTLYPSIAPLFQVLHEIGQGSAD